MAGKYSTYASYPGRQHYVLVVPRAFGSLFFEGIQSMDAASNVNETTHGQYGFKSDVLISKTYTNTSGSVALKDFNNASFVLRAMTGIEPSESFIFDPTLLEPVDVVVNIYNDDRTRIMRSCWYVDFTPTVSQNSTLDDIETGTINYTAVRKIDFEGKQIICETFPETKAGQTSVVLPWKAVVDPTIQNSVVDPVTGLAIGEGRHDLCPFQFLLRVWVGDQILDDPDAAGVTTVDTGSGLQSTVFLRDPLPDVDKQGNGPIVKVMWLADGADNVPQKGVTAAPVMVGVVPDLDTTANPATFLGTMKVHFSKAISDAALTSISSSLTSFELTFGAAGGTAYKMNPTAINTTNLSVAGNVLELDFTGAVTTPAGGTWSAGDDAELEYTHIPSAVLMDVDGFTTPVHSLTLQPF